MKAIMLPKFALAITFLIAFHAQAQDYIITNKGDTIRGELKPLTYGPDKKVTVVGENKKKTTYSLFQVRSYSYKGDIFQPVKGPQGYTFMKLLRPGYLTLYGFQPENQVNYDGLFLVKKDGTSIEIPNLGFKKAMKRFVEECPAVATRIENGELSKKEINQIVDDFNACVNENTVDHEKVIAQQNQTNKKVNVWDSLEEKIKTEPAFNGKADALDMVTEIKSKLSKGETIPKFLIEGLKQTLSTTTLNADLEKALQEIR